MEIITISRINDNGNEEYFFTTNHCQKHGLGNQWVSCTYTLPMKIVPRDGLPSGLVTNKEEWKAVFEKSPIIDEFGIQCKCIEIPNPNPEFQA